MAVVGDAPDFTSPRWSAAAAALGLEFLGLPPATIGLEAVFESAQGERADAVLQRTGPGIVGNAGRIGGLSERYRLPGVSPFRPFAEGGGLLVYQARDMEIRRRGAEYVDLILRGARPSELPVEFPNHYDLILNLRTARGLGLTFSREFLGRVDETIE